MKGINNKTVNAFQDGSGLFIFLLITIAMNAQHNSATKDELDARQQAIVAIAALTATGNLEALKIQLNNGLDQGLTINELKEVLTQLYAYCGFPRSPNAISSLMNVLKIRKARH